MPANPLVFDSRGPDANRAYIALALALIGQISAKRALAAVVVKGAAAELTGLRQSCNFSDVDIIVRPAELGVFRHELEQRGWLVRPFDDRDGVFPKHSVSMYHPRWPIDIDIHYRFPGFEANPESVIDEVLKDSLFVSAGNHQLRIPSQLGCLVFQALHQLRSPWEAGTQEVLAELQRRSQNLDLARLVNFAQQTNCLAALRPFLEQRRDFTAEDIVFPEPSTEWRIRTLGKDSASIRIFTLLQAPWQEKPKLVWRAIFPSRTALAARDLAIKERKGNLPGVYARRFLRFCRAIPQTARSVHHLLTATTKNQQNTVKSSIERTDRKRSRAH